MKENDPINVLSFTELDGWKSVLEKLKTNALQ